LKISLESLSLRLVAAEDPERARATRDVVPATLTQVYGAHFDFVWRNARRLGVPEALADDVAQDVFLVVARRIGSFDGRASIRSWIFGILVRVVRDHKRRFRRKSARNVPLDTDFSTEDQSQSPHGTTPFEAAEQAERARFLERLLAPLTEDQRTLLILAELEQWTLRELAELFHSNTSTIYSRLQAAKREVERVYASLQTGKEDRLP
jgi:RNA polymerase sigma-70 factor, ECF subfamily